MTELHAYYAGSVLGLLIRHGVPAEAIHDADGKVTDRIVLTLSPKVKLEIAVPPPPEGWQPR